MPVRGSPRERISPRRPLRVGGVCRNGPGGPEEPRGSPAGARLLAGCRGRRPWLNCLARPSAQELGLGAALASAAMLCCLQEVAASDAVAKRENK